MDSRLRTSFSNDLRIYNQFNDYIKRSMPKSKFDLSHDVKTAFNLGSLVPFLCLETLPNDRFKISSDIFLRFAPLVLPIMHRLEVCVDYFYVPNRILWDRWEDFISMKDDTLENPYIRIDQNDFEVPTDTAWRLHHYLGYPCPLNDGSVALFREEINVLPIAGYYKIWNDFYRNDQIQEEIFISLQSGDSGLNVDQGFFEDGGTPSQNPDVINYNLALINKNWNRDYFTAALPEAQAGDEVLIPLITSNRDLPFMPPNVDFGGPTRWRKYTDGTDNVSGDFDYAVNPAGGRSTRIDITDFVYLDIQETAGTIRELRYASQMQQFLERLNKVGDKYRDYIIGFFGNDPMPMNIDEAVYLGGWKAPVQISEVLNVVDIPSTTNALGDYAGFASSVKNGKNIEFGTPEHGHIYGIISVTPRSSYFQGEHRMWQRKEPMDYALPEFAMIGDQEILNRELKYQWDPLFTDQNDQTFGYIERYAEYKYHLDQYMGPMVREFRDFHLGRTFGEAANTPTLDALFVQCIPREYDVFVGVDEDQRGYDPTTFAYIYNNITAERVLPKVAITGKI
jgi:hypothetical protein